MKDYLDCLEKTIDDISVMDDKTPDYRTSRAKSLLDDFRILIEAIYAAEGYPDDRYEYIMDAADSITQQGDYLKVLYEGK